MVQKLPRLGQRRALQTIFKGVFMSTHIFKESKLGSILLKNKLLRSATHEGLADENGFPTEELTKKYVQLAKGEAGAIITGFAGVAPAGKSSAYRMLMIDKDESVEHYKKLVDAVHQYNTPIILQVAHCGRQTRSKVTGYPTEAPSGIKDKFYNEDVPRELTDAEIRELIGSFVKAICRAKKAGFDGVQIHGAHGYLLSEFLSPHMNRRNDIWGGSSENRFRIIAEIYKQAREKVGDYPILIKINGHEYTKGGVTIPQAVEYARMLEKAGCCAIEVSCGIGEDGLNTARCEKVPMDQVFKYVFSYKKIPVFLRPVVKFFAQIAVPSHKPLKKYNIPAAKAIKEQVSIPVIAVGGLGSIEEISFALENGGADFVSMCRPFIIEPGIVKKFREKKQEQSKCLYCNYCLVAVETNKLRCYYGKVK